MDKVAMIRVLDEFGFDRSFITRITGVPKRTANEIVNRRGPWRAFIDPNKELYTLTYFRVRSAILEHANELAIHALKEIERKIDGADCLQAVYVGKDLIEIGQRVAKRGDGG